MKDTQDTYTSYHHIDVCFRQKVKQKHTSDDDRRTTNTRREDPSDDRNPLRKISAHVKDTFGGGSDGRISQQTLTLWLIVLIWTEARGREEAVEQK